MSTLKPIYSIVARELALGISLADICEARGLKLESVQKVSRGALFKEEVKRFQAEIDKEMVSEAVSDPVLKKLRSLSYRAVGTLGDEMDNFDSGAGGTAATRISASKAILDRAGYGTMKDDKSSTNVIIMLTEGKLNSVKVAKEVTEKIINDVPDCVDGHLAKVG